MVLVDLVLDRVMLLHLQYLDKLRKAEAVVQATSESDAEGMDALRVPITDAPPPADPARW